MKSNLKILICITLYKPQFKLLLSDNRREIKSLTKHYLHNPSYFSDDAYGCIYSEKFHFYSILSGVCVTSEITHA